MKIVHRYILREAYGPFLIGMFAFLLVVLLHRFSKLADLVIAKGIPAVLLGRLLLSLLPAFLEIVLPATLLLATLLALGRLASDSETTALRTAGIGMRGVALPVILLSAATFAATLAIGWKGVSWGEREMRSVLARIVSLRAGAAAEERVFHEIAPDVLLYPDRVSPDGTKMYGVFLSQQLPNEDSLLVFARSGEFFPESAEDAVKLGLSDGTIHDDAPAEGIYRAGSFRSLTFRIPRAGAAFGGGSEPRALTLPELWSRSVAEAGTPRGASYRYHFHRRLCLAASSLAFGLFAIPLGMLQRSRGKSPAFALTIGLIVFFYLFLAAAGSLEAAAPRAMVAVIWFPNAAVLLFTAWVFHASERRTIALPDLLARLRGGR